MKIDTDLRAAIRSAERAQPSTDWQVIQKQNAAAIEAFLLSHPAKAKKAKMLVAAAVKAKKAEDAARAALCEQFGLRHYNGSFEFANCGDGKGRFERAGGKLPKKLGARWKFDTVMAELASADQKDCKKILSKYGIKWA